MPAVSKREQWSAIPVRVMSLTKKQPDAQDHPTGAQRWAQVLLQMGVDAMYLAYGKRRAKEHIARIVDEFFASRG